MNFPKYCQFCNLRLFKEKVFLKNYTCPADITITIRDVNDEAPKFNQPEYKVSLQENVPFGTPLANLNMEVKDLDTAPNAVFEVNLGQAHHMFSRFLNLQIYETISRNLFVLFFYKLEVFY